VIFGQGARLVTHDILYLTQLFRDVQSATLDPFLGLGMVHLLVLRDEKDLTEFDHLNADVEGNWDHHLVI